MFWERSLPFGKLFNLILIISLILIYLAGSPTSAFGRGSFLVLCYHDILNNPLEVDDISQTEFINHLEYFKTHGYVFLRPQDILAAAKGGSTLPPQAVLLTFDDAYESFYKFVWPVLQLYKIPVVLSVVTSWIDNPEAAIYKTKKLMTWEQLQEVAASGLVTIASHTHDSHHFILANPPGNVEPATETFSFFPHQQRYETEQEFRRRIRSDLAESINKLQSKVGVTPYIITWPYGAYNNLALQEAAGLGFKMALTLDEGLAQINNLMQINRLYMKSELYWAPSFRENLAKKFRDDTPIRAVQVDLDAIVEPSSYDQSDQNLGALIDRLVAIGVNTVFLQGFADRDGSGNIRRLYFANRVLPVEMDFLSHAVNRLRVQGIKVFVWMPVLSYELPDPQMNKQLKVREFKDGQHRVTTSWYQRLSPFAPQTINIVGEIYRHLAAQVNFDGILFQDDAYLNDFEDFHPAALERFNTRYGLKIYPGPVGDKPWRWQWQEFKTKALKDFIDHLTAIVKRYRPRVKIARNIYSGPVLNSTSEEWFAQNFSDYLKTYDYTVIMAYANMEKVTNRHRWFAELVERAKIFHALDKVVFKVQSYDWQNKAWLKGEKLSADLRVLMSQGARHIAYYPDDVYLDKPEKEEISLTISGREDMPVKW